MIRLIIIGIMLSVAFGSGVSVAHKYYQVKILQAKVLFLEDQQKKRELAEKRVAELEAEQKNIDKNLDKDVEVLEKGVPKNVRTNDRIILPDSWMQQLRRIR
jgi:uncharacterized protein YdeI (YjbR/CyaY-like superfamily)